MTTTSTTFVDEVIGAGIGASTDSWEFSGSSVADYDLRFDRQPVVRCPDCHRAQALHNDLHEGPFGLLYWHADHPNDAVDHLETPPDRLAVPACIHWWAYDHWLAIEDKRTEGSTLLGTDCLEILQAVSADNGLERAVYANTRG